MMYCVNCEYPITRNELDNRKCNHCGKHPHVEDRTAPAPAPELEPEYHGDIRDPAAGCWHITNQNWNSTVFGPDHCRQPCVPGTRYCKEHQR